jgi:hypothetical protein
MAFDYSEIADVSDEILEEFGQIVTLTHANEGVYIPGTGYVPPDPAETTQTGTGAVVDWDSGHIDGTLILIGDKRLLLSPLNAAGAVLTAPALGDTVTDAAGVVYTLVAPLKTVSPAGTVVLYDVNLRV